MRSPFGRRTSRVPKEIAILLIGSDVDGRVFSEETKTVILSQHGAGILSQYKLAPEQEVVLRRLDTQKEAEVRVVGQIGAQDDVYTYGVAFLDPHIDLWNIEFPSMTESDRLNERRLLECSGCKGRAHFGEDAMEADVYTVNQRLVRYCQRCGAATLWQQASEDPEAPLVSPRQPSSEAAPASPPVQVPTLASPMPQPEAVSGPETARPATPESPARPENQRKHHRAKVSWHACIRRGGHADDVVVCEDISRGGLRFKSRRAYQPGWMIEVAVPYKPGEAAIFVPAKIVHVQELPNHKGFQCGVAYVKGGVPFA